MATATALPLNETVQSRLQARSSTAYNSTTTDSSTDTRSLRRGIPASGVEFSLTEKRFIESASPVSFQDDPPPPYTPHSPLAYSQTSATATTTSDYHPFLHTTTAASNHHYYYNESVNDAYTNRLSGLTSHSLVQSVSTLARRWIDHLGGESAYLIMLCLAWYASSSIANNVGKQLLNIFHYPVTVSWIQFAFIAVYGVIAAKGLGLSRLQEPSFELLKTIVPLCGFQIGSQVLTSIATSQIPISSVHTVKALSPLFTVIVYRMVYGARYSPRVYLALIPLTLGVMLACMSELKLQFVGLLCALGSSMVYVAQNVFSKRVLFRDTGDNVANAKPRMDKLNMLIWSACSAFICLTPGWFYAEGAQLLFGHGEIGGRPYPVFNDDTPIYLIGYYFFLNATAHFCQALLAINVLATCTAVSYSIASLMKRVVVITVALLWFQQPVSSVQAFGILLTFYGLWLYDRAKSDVKATERQADNVYSVNGGLLLLPWSVKQV